MKHEAQHLEKDMATPVSGRQLAEFFRGLIAESEGITPNEVTPSYIRQQQEEIELRVAFRSENELCGHLHHHLATRARGELENQLDKVMELAEAIG